MDYSNNPNAIHAMVNLRGRVSWVHSWEVDNLKKAGYRMILNPKKDYFPEWDQELNKVSSHGDVLENADPDVLPVEEL